MEGLFPKAFEIRASLFIVHSVLVVLRTASYPFVYVAVNSTLPHAHSLVLKRESA